MCRVIASVALTALAACAEPRFHYRLVEPPSRVEPRLRPGDVLAIGLEAPGASAIGVDPRGRVSFEPVGEIEVGGRTVAWLQDEINHRLDAIDSHHGPVAIVLDVAASPHVNVTGQVQRVGPVHFEAGLSLVGAILACGGFTSAAKPRRVIVTRAGATGAIRYRLSVTAIMHGEAPDFSLLAGDVVYVSESGI